MIQSRLSYRFILKIIAFFIFSNLFIASICTSERDYPEKGIYDFDASSFMLSNVILLAVCGVAFLIVFRKKRRILIGANKIVVRIILTKKEIEFSFAEINGLTWGTAISNTSDGHGPNMRSSVQHANVLFKDGSELLLSNYEYRNYEELRDFFYNYCLKNHLIENVIENRKKRRNRL